MDGQSFKVKTFVRGSGKRVTNRTPPKFLTSGVVDESTDYRSPKAFTVNFDYDKLGGTDGESVIVIGVNYHDCMAEAYDNRKFKHRKPYSVELVDPDLNTAVKFLTGAKDKAKDLGAKFKIAQADVKKFHSNREEVKRIKEYEDMGKSQSGLSRFMGKVKAKSQQNVADRLKKHGFFGEILGEDLEEKSKAVSAKIQTKSAAKYLRDSWDDDPQVRSKARSMLKQLYPDIWEATDFSTEATHYEIEKVSDPKEIPKFISQSKHSDIVIGNRFLNEIKVRRGYEDEMREDEDDKKV